MKKIFIFCIIILILHSCRKSGGGFIPKPEPNIVFSIDASNASVSVSNSFVVNVVLTSAMPSSQGIKIESSLVDQTNNSPLTQNPSVTSQVAKNTIRVINIVQQHWCMATIKVSSFATPTNSSSQSFTVVYK